MRTQILTAVTVFIATSTLPTGIAFAEDQMDVLFCNEMQKQRFAEKLQASADDWTRQAEGANLRAREIQKQLDATPLVGIIPQSRAAKRQLRISAEQTVKDRVEGEIQALQFYVQSLNTPGADARGMDQKISEAYVKAFENIDASVAHYLTELESTALARDKNTTTTTDQEAAVRTLENLLIIATIKENVTKNTAVILQLFLDNFKRNCRSSRNTR